MVQFVRIIIDITSKRIDKRIKLLKIVKRTAVYHYECYYSRQHTLQVSVSTDHHQALNT